MIKPEIRGRRQSFSSQIEPLSPFSVKKPILSDISRQSDLLPESALLQLNADKQLLKSYSGINAPVLVCLWPHRTTTKKKPKNIGYIT